MQETLSAYKLYDDFFQIDDNNEKVNTFSEKRELQIGLNT